MSSTREAFLRAIEGFCAERKVSLSEFGERAVRDRGFVFRLRKGGGCQLDTYDRVNDFMAGKVASRDCAGLSAEPANTEAAE